MTNYFLPGLLLSLLWIGIMQVASAQQTEAPASLEASVVSHTVEGDEEDLDFFDEEADADIIVSDPIEALNRAIFWFNDKVYFYALKPVARVYRIIPRPVRRSVANFFSNLAMPVRLVSSLLQGKGRAAGTELTRFGVNSTVGVLGLFDPAKRYLHLEKKDEDLGQAFGRYGVGTGFYIVIPFVGPSNVRDAIGRIGDYFLDPATFLVAGGKDRLAITTGRSINTLSLDRDTYEGIKRDEIDPYLFIRNAYQQQREAKIRQ